MGDRICSASFDISFREESDIENRFTEWLTGPTPKYVATWKDASDYEHFRRELAKAVATTAKNPNSIPYGGLDGVVCDSLYEIMMECKIVGYWYPGTVAFFRDLAQFFNGEIELENDSGSRQKLIFQDYKVTLQNEIRDWSEPEMFEEYFSEELVDIPLPEQEELARKL